MKTFHIIRHVGLVLLLAASSQPQVFSQSEQVMTRLEGSWQGEGKSFGMEARLSLRFEWVLANKFLRLSIKNEMKAANGPMIFEGHAYYKSLGEGKFKADWFDSRGESFPIKAHAEAETLVALWGSPEKEQGKSTYRVIETGKIEVVDSVLQKDGTYREFGRFVLGRQ